MSGWGENRFSLNILLAIVMQAFSLLGIHCWVLGFFGKLGLGIDARVYLPLVSREWRKL